MKRTLSRTRSSNARSTGAKGRTRLATGNGHNGPASTRQGNYRDFVITARRLDARKVGVSVETSPVGRLDALVSVVYLEKEAAALKRSFIASISGQKVEGGRMMLSADEALAIGRRLSAVLFPPEVFRLFAASLAAVTGTGGLRIRLSMDPSLMDLPWEYVTRPDRRSDGDGHVSDFLLLDPSISMVRQAADATIALPPITGKQRLAFVGTFWEGKRDMWEVGKEFRLLGTALEPVASFIKPDFSSASDPKAIGTKALAGAAIFHYAGHSDFDRTGRAFVIKELPTTHALEAKDTIYVDELAPRLADGGTRLAVLSACNSGYWAVAKPLLNAGVPVVIGVNGGVASISTIEFCAKLYESLAVGLTLDEAVQRARMHLFEWGPQYDLFDWGLFMVHMACPEAVIFPRRANAAVEQHQRTVRQAHAETVGSTLALMRQMDGLNFGEIMSELTQRRVLILGRFSRRRLPVLEAIKTHLKGHKNNYLPELFTFEKPKSRDLVEAIKGFAALSRFVIADLSEPRSVQQELEAIAPDFLSVPIVPLINHGGKEYATFSAIRRRPQVVQPTIKYRNVDDLIVKLDTEVVPQAETKLLEVRPPARS
jgi:hypothetical protein